ncbi:hypothetical protein, partial [Actimicrobium sp. CCI2.3]|uniref:hypothetical protein n=1 Tax=Actimicrobium sp. CCI2.3 TaxID=3048616 RepID=UPI002B246800
QTRYAQTCVTLIPCLTPTFGSCFNAEKVNVNCHFNININPKININININPHDYRSIVDTLFKSKPFSG